MGGLLGARAAAVALLFGTVGSTCSEIVGSLSGALKGVGEARVATVACCGASKLGKTPVLSTSTSCQRVEMVPGTTALALICADSIADCSIAVASSDVVLLELRQSDLEADGPHGVAQLAPLLQRALPLRGVKPQKKLLVLVVKQDDESISKDELEALASAALERVWAGLRMPEGAPAALDEFFETSLVYVPAGSGTEKAIATLRARFRDAGRTDYIFKQGAWSTPATNAFSALRAISETGPVPGETSFAASDAQVAYRSAQISERAAKSFAKGLAALRKSSESTVLLDFGERLRSLFEDTLSTFDADAQGLQHLSTSSAARAALVAQLSRAAAPTCRRQLALLQLSTRDKFMQKLQAVRPSLEVEKELRQMVKDSGKAFEAAAKAALPSPVSLSYSFEKRAVVNSMAEAARAQVELWRIQGLYLPLEGFKTPVDIGLHWLIPKFMGADSKFDSISPRDRPKYRPRAQPMRVRPIDGYKAYLKDPKDMVFDNKMPA